MRLLPSPTTPIEAILLAGDWQLAALVGALVGVPGAVDQFEALHRRALTPTTDVPVKTVWTGRSRAVRPPRAC